MKTQNIIYDTPHLAYTTLVIILLSSSLGHTASYNCKTKGLTSIEQTICDTPKLSSLDDTLAKDYRLINQLLSGEEKQTFKQTQRKWLQDRQQCAHGNTISCLKDSYDLRIAQLYSYQHKLNGNAKADGYYLNGITGWVYILSAAFYVPGGLPPMVEVLAYGETPKQCIDAYKKAQNADLAEKLYEKTGFPAKISCIESHVEGLDAEKIQKLTKAQYLGEN